LQKINQDYIIFADETKRCGREDRRRKRRPWLMANAWAGRREGGKRGEEGLWLYSKVERLFYAGILVIFHMKLYTYLSLSLSLS